MVRRFGLPVRRVEIDPMTPVDHSTWPGGLPVVRQLAREGLDLGPVTILVGENGSGKSTLIEAIAGALGLSPTGGSRNLQPGRADDVGGLHRHLRVTRGISTGRNWAYFLRAESMHQVFGELNQLGPGRTPQEDLLAMSHGESFLALLHSRFSGPGFYLLDEPESALSFQATLSAIAVLADAVSSGGAQIVMATHSPVLAALPGARILEISEDGWADCAWEDLGIVRHSRQFLNHPQSYLAHLGVL